MGSRITDVVKNLLILNVLMFLATITLEGRGIDLTSMFSLHNPFREGSGFQPYQIVTSMFMHANPMHLLSNMIGLFFIAPIIEMRLGAKRFLAYYLITGLGATAVFMLVSALTETDPVANYLLLGASGALSGVMMAFMLYYPNIKLMLLFFPVPIKAKYLIGGMLIYDIIMGFLGNGSFIGVAAGTSVAHTAHVGGALFGFLLITFWRKRGKVL